MTIQPVPQPQYVTQRCASVPVAPTFLKRRETSAEWAARMEACRLRVQELARGADRRQYRGQA